MKTKKQPTFRKCRTVGALIKQLERLTEQAAHEGISAEELAREIGKWHGSLPNAGRHGRI